MYIEKSGLKIISAMPLPEVVLYFKLMNLMPVE
jgi:hypothetical protein